MLRRLLDAFSATRAEALKQAPNASAMLALFRVSHRRSGSTEYIRGRPQRQHLKKWTRETANNRKVSRVHFFLVLLREDQAGAVPVVSVMSGTD